MMFWVIIIASMLASFIVGKILQSKFNKYTKVPLATGLSGKEVAERMEGAYQPDFYGPYLEDRMVQGRKVL